jgi:Tol biopolymer transport system component
MPPGRIIIFGMKATTIAAIIVLLVLVAAGLILYAWNSKPRIVEISPQSGEENISAVSSIRVVFSRSMDQGSVNSRLTVEPATEGTIQWQENSLVFMPDEPWPNGKEIQVHLDDGAKSATWLAFPMDGQSWSFTIRATGMAYLWPSNGPADIYILDPATGAIFQVTKSMDVLEYTASLDGRWLYFSAGNSQGGADIYKIDRMRAENPMDPSYQAEKLLDCGMAQCRSPVISPDNQTLAYEYLLPTPKGGAGPVQVWTLRLTDLVATQVGQTGNETVQPAWSMKGLLAYYDRTSSTYDVYDPATRQVVQLPNQTGQPGTWSPDGATYLAPEITYQPSSGGYETGNSHLISYNTTNNVTADISGDQPVEDVEAAYSPDGSSIAFTRKFLDTERWSQGRQVWIMGADGSNPHALTDEPDYNHYDLAWSRDGSELAYVRFNQVKISDPPELWMASLEGNPPVQLVIGGYSPTWIP